jgi:hypothetical protein
MDQRILAVCVTVRELSIYTYIYIYIYIYDSLCSSVGAKQSFRVRNWIMLRGVAVGYDAFIYFFFVSCTN